MFVWYSLHGVSCDVICRRCFGNSSSVFPETNNYLTQTTTPSCGEILPSTTTYMPKSSATTDETVQQPCQHDRQHLTSLRRPNGYLDRLVQRECPRGSHHPSSNDTWYGETTNPIQIHKLKSMNPSNTTMYRQTELGTPLACRELEQHCFTGIKGVQKCSLLQSPDDAIHNLYSQLDEGDESLVSLVPHNHIYDHHDAKDPLMILGTRTLRARYYLNGPILGPLPENQWQLEVLHWHATAMVHMQQAFVRPIVGCVRARCVIRPANAGCLW